MNALAIAATAQTNEAVLATATLHTQEEAVVVATLHPQEFEHAHPVQGGAAQMEVEGANGNVVEL